MHRDIILEAISKMSFKDSIQFFVETLSIHAANKSDDNFFLCHTFKSYLKEHLEEFKNQITKNETLKDNLKKLFELNTYIYDDNLISIIIDDKNSAELIEILNENVDFEKYYLNDNIMSFITPENKSIFEKLKGNNRKYVFSITNSITIPEEEQKKVYDKVLSELPQKFIDNLFLFNNVIRENIEDNIFALTNAILEKDSLKALKIYNDLLLMGEEPIKLIVMISNQFRLILQVKLMVKNGYKQIDMANIIKEHPFRVKLALSSNYSEKELTNNIKKLYKLDYDIKSGNIDKNFGLELFLLNV